MVKGSKPELNKTKQTFKRFSQRLSEIQWAECE